MAQAASGTPAAAKSAAKSAVPARKVWTATDLDRLRAEPSHGVTVVETASASVSPEAVIPQAGAGPQGVPARLQEMVSEAQANLARLERERLAAGNPLLRGLAGGQPIRSTEEIDKDRLKWSERLRLAATALANSEGSVPPPSPAGR